MNKERGRRDRKRRYIYDIFRLFDEKIRKEGETKVTLIIIIIIIIIVISRLCARRGTRGEYEPHTKKKKEKRMKNY